MFVSKKIVVDKEKEMANYPYKISREELKKIYDIQDKINKEEEKSKKIIDEAKKKIQLLRKKVIEETKRDVWLENKKVFDEIQDYQEKLSEEIVHSCTSIVIQSLQSIVENIPETLKIKSSVMSVLENYQDNETALLLVNPQQLETAMTLINHQMLSVEEDESININECLLKCKHTSYHSSFTSRLNLLIEAFKNTES
ncbi:MAG: HrpE/YscL family type III secretion apparatus protein [Pseudomonadota bacterium]